MKAHPVDWAVETTASQGVKMEDEYDDIKVEVLDEEGLREAVDNAMALAGCSWEELQNQAQAGQFTDEIARSVWFAVSSLVEPATA